MVSPRQSLSLKACALRYLSRREHSRVELRRKLLSVAQSEQAIDALLDWLESQNWLSGARFAESVVRRRADRYGTARLMQELTMHQCGDDILREVRTRLQASEAARAKAVWARRFGHSPADAAERARQIRFMLARGFSQGVVSRLIQGADEMPGDVDAQC